MSPCTTRGSTIRLHQARPFSSFAARHGRHRRAGTRFPASVDTSYPQKTHSADRYKNPEIVFIFKPKSAPIVAPVCVQKTLLGERVFSFAHRASLGHCPPRLRCLRPRPYVRGRLRSPRCGSLRSSARRADALHPSIEVAEARPRHVPPLLFGPSDFTGRGTSYRRRAKIERRDFCSQTRRRATARDEGRAPCV